jgi:small multidrug resistance pump
MPLALLVLAIAVGVEVVATSLLPRTEGFTDLRWSVVVLLGYGISVGLLSVVIRTIPVSVAYAIWAGAGTALVAVIGATVLGEPMSPVKAISLGLIVIGVVGLNLSGTH